MFTSSNRARPEIRNLIGQVYGAAVLSVDISAAQTFRDVLDIVRRNYFKALQDDAIPHVAVQKVFPGFANGMLLDWMHLTDEQTPDLDSFDCDQAPTPLPARQPFNLYLRALENSNEVFLTLYFREGMFQRKDMETLVTELNAMLSNAKESAEFELLRFN